MIAQITGNTSCTGVLGKIREIVDALNSVGEVVTVIDTAADLPGVETPLALTAAGQDEATPLDFEPQTVSDYFDGGQQPNLEQAASVTVARAPQADFETIGNGMPRINFYAEGTMVGFCYMNSSELGNGVITYGTVSPATTYYYLANSVIWHDTAVGPGWVYQYRDEENTRQYAQLENLDDLPTMQNIDAIAVSDGAPVGAFAGIILLSVPGTEKPAALYVNAPYIGWVSVGGVGLPGQKGDKGDTGGVGATGPQGPAGDLGYTAPSTGPLAGLSLSAAMQWLSEFFGGAHKDVSIDVNGINVA